MAYFTIPPTPPPSTKKPHPDSYLFLLVVVSGMVMIAVFIWKGLDEF